MCKKPSKPRLRHLPVDLMQNQDEVSGHLTMVLRLSKYVSNKCIAVRKVATLLRELTCHMGSQCHLPPSRGDIPALTPAEVGTRLSDLGEMQG